MRGRLDRQTKLWGFRIELAEVESTVLATGADSPGTLPRRLSEALGARLPGYMIPARWLALPEGPLGSTGKVDRRAPHRMLPGPQ